MAVAEAQYLHQDPELCCQYCGRREKLPNDAAEQLQKLMNDPMAFGLSIVFALFVQFILLTVLCAVGGALSAKLNPPPKQQS